MNRLLQDLRSAARTMRRRPLLTLAALLTLAIGIGANTAIFSVVETVLIHPLPYRDAERLVYLYQENTQLNITTTPSAELIHACREQARSFEQIETYSTRTFNLTGEGEPARLTGARVSPRLFSFLGVNPQLGRTFLAGEGRSEEYRVMLLGHGLWQSRFGGDPDVLGRSLEVDDESYRIVGILPPAFRLEAYSEIRFWIPQVTELDADESEPLYAIARLEEEISVDAAQAELDLISRRLVFRSEEDAGFSDLEWTGKVFTPQARLDNKTRTAILVLQAAVGLVLLIACTNIANLLLAQREERSRELAIRTVLGAGRGRLVRQLLTESLVLSLLGGALGLLLSLWGVDTILSLLPGELRHLDRLELNEIHLLFTLLVAVASGVFFGLLPALRGSTPDLNEYLKQSATGGGSRGTLLRGFLVSSEVALALMLLVGAGLLIKSFVRLQAADPGFTAENLLTLRMELPEKRYSDESRQMSFYDTLLDSLSEINIAQVESVTLTNGVVSDIDAILGKPELDGSAVNTDDPKQLLIVFTGTPGYFQTMGIPLLRGRGFTDDDREEAEPVIVINETLARRYLPGEDGVGRRIRFADTWYRIVGVAADLRLPPWGTERVFDLQVFYPTRQSSGPAMTLAVRTTPKADQKFLVDALKARIWAIDPHVPVTRIATGDELLADSLARQRFNAILMTLFAAIAAALTSVGIYGVVAYSVSRHTRDIGIRVALGARAGDVLLHVISRGMVTVGAGIVGGLAGAWVLARILAGLLHDVSVRDPAIFGAVSLLVTAIAFFAIWLPARQAARIEPVTALRHE